jgi:hypothetical protein
MFHVLAEAEGPNSKSGKQRIKNMRIGFQKKLQLLPHSKLIDER